LSADTDGQYDRLSLSAVALTANTEARQLSAKNLEKKKNICHYSYFVEYKNEEKMQNFSYETTLVAIIDMLTYLPSRI